MLEMFDSLEWQLRRAEGIVDFLKGLKRRQDMEKNTHLACAISEMQLAMMHMEEARDIIQEKEAGAMGAMIPLNDDFEQILISAERYSCGRMTYVVPTFVRFVKPLVPDLSDKTLDIFIRDFIEKSMREEPGWGDGMGPFGMEQDRKEWQELWDAIEAEQKRRLAEL